MASLINIAGTQSVDDPEYRYKMPRVKGKVEGRGNGIKTVIANVGDLSLALKREPGEITKFFGCELGAQTTWRPETERAIVNGAHTDMALQQLVHKYIELFVLCPNCRLPESMYKIKHGLIMHQCLACGAKDPIDMTHKLCTFILNQEKKAKMERAKERAAKKSKEGKDKDKSSSKKEKSSSSKKDKDKAASADGNDEPSVDGDSKKKSHKAKKEKSGDDSGGDGDSNGSGGKANSNGHINGNGHAVSDPDELASDDGFGSEDEDAPTADNVEVDDASAFANTVSAVKRHIADGASIDKLAEEVRTAQTFAAFPVAQRFHIFISARFEGAATITEADIASIAPVVRLVSPGISARDDQLALIGAFELLCAVREPQLLPHFAKVLKWLYDEKVDLIEEETILAWNAAQLRAEADSTGLTSAAVTAEHLAKLKKVAQPMVKWLKEAGDEEDDDDEEEDED